MVSKLAPGVMAAVPLVPTPPSGLAKSVEMQRAEKEKMQSDCLMLLFIISLVLKSGTNCLPFI
jgi:hypothetical protein